MPPSNGQEPDDTVNEKFKTANGCLDYDVLIIGGGLSGIFSLYRIRELDLRVKVLEAGSSEGDTWFWNRYSGARFDSEKVLDEWNWTEHFSPQTETLRYIQYLTKKFDLKKDMQFDTRILWAQFREDSTSWLLADSTGVTCTSRYLVTAMDILNEPTLSNISGVQDYKGKSWHTARWPSEGANLEGKRVAVIGTGATGIQIIQEIAKTAGSLTVFQRTPNWTAPLRNTRIGPEEMAQIRQRHPETFQRCLDSPKGFIHFGDKRSVFDTEELERLEHWKTLYALPGFAKVLSISAYQRPRHRREAYSKNHGFGTRRVSLESGYHEAFNRPKRIADKGINTWEDEFEIDIILYATGEGIRTFIGLTVKGFSNMFMIIIEYAVGWVADFLWYARDRKLTFVEATDEGMQHVWQCGEGLLPNEVDSWMTGINRNLAHKQKRSMTRYNGPAPGYRKRCDEAKAKGYSDFMLG
ncbi:phenylacetone monooxygenase [Colletotrichum navitas]|uniref:Phenylacetone monooxygenase n=1 Tax=Colletotrichum navitas TaxID=681940 RepID=A0AAD8V5E5_9PEZI|nr:phenylacetone monooxygenase [Colletotrichum navitas]KAK1593554.1 phenylacetone monooxygenase [Colletotrichum navitas]